MQFSPRNKMLPTVSWSYFSNSQSKCSDSTLADKLMEGLEVEKEPSSQTMSDIIILFLSSMALNESTRFKNQKNEFSDLVSKLSEWLSPELMLLNKEMDDSMRFNNFFKLLSGLLTNAGQSIDEHIRKRLSNELNVYFSRLLALEKNMFVFINHDATSIFGDLLLSNLFGIIFCHLIRSHSISIIQTYCC